MPSDRWKEIRAHFDALVDLEPAGRRAALEELRQRDPELAGEVARLLEHAERADDRFEAALVSAASDALLDLDDSEDDIDSLPDGGRIGPYQVVERLGRGGGGTVFRAERVDGAYEHDVAIKVLRRGLDTADLLARFRAERQILASLSHPFIARLLDGGSLPDGRPYLVMEFVDGMPIDAWCEERGLSVRARIELFLDVCEAVSHAHRNLVLHRDLKPSNILVGTTGEVRLLDFGIAKILDPSAVPGTSARTRAGVRLLTPDFAAPEQLEGRTVDVTTDVYQLGHLLYRLLTGCSPHSPAGESTGSEPSRILERDVPDPPSEAAREGGERWWRSLRGDLDAVVTKALHREPERRYGSVEQLTADLRRHLEGRPVHARPDGVLYRGAKFVRRRPGAVAAVVATLALLVLGLGALGLHSTRLQAERDRAQLQAVRAETATGFLIDLFDLAGDSGARDTITVGALLERGREHLDERVGDHPLMRLELLHALEQAHDRMAMGEEAIVLAETRARGAIDYHGPDHIESVLALEALGRRRAGARHWAEAEAAFVRAHEIRERLPPDVLASDTAQASLGSSLNSLATAYRETGRTDEALELVHEAIALGADGPEAESVTIRAREAGRLAFALRGAGRYDEAEGLYQEAISLAREGAETVLPSLLNNYASLLRGTGREEEAAPLLREARDRLWPEEGHPGNNLDILQMNLVSLLSELGRHREAIEIAREGEALLRETLPADHWRVARAVRGVGTAYLEAGECERGEPILREAVELTAVAVGPTTAETAIGRNILAHCLIELERLDEAEAELLEARPRLLAASNPPPAPIARNLEALVRVYELTDRPAEAERCRALLEEHEGGR